MSVLWGDGGGRLAFNCWFPNSGALSLSMWGAVRWGEIIRKTKRNNGDGMAVARFCWQKRATESISGQSYLSFHDGK